MIKSTPIYDGITEFKSHKVKSFHAPGHKGMLKFEGIYELDVMTPEGHDTSFFLRGMQECADIFGALRSFYITGGVKNGILAMLRAVCKAGDKIIVDRNCSRYVYDAIILLGLNPVYVKPQYMHQFGFTGGMSPDAIAKVTDENPDAKAVIISSPNGYGVISDIRSIAEIVHIKGMMLLNDESNGAHLNFSKHLPNSSVATGADMCVQSLYNTLGSLFGTAVLHVCSDRINCKMISDTLSFFEPEIPSATLYAAIESAVVNATEFEKRYEKILDRVEVSRNQVNSGGKIYWFGTDFNDSCGIYDIDKTKILINFSKVNYTGFEIADILKNEYGIEVDIANDKNIVCTVTPYTNLSDIKKLEKAVRAIVRGIKFEHAEIVSLNTEAENYVGMIPRDAIEGETEYISIAFAEGRISAGVISRKLTGRILIAPGEEIRAENIKEMSEFLNKDEILVGVNEEYEILVVKA